MWGSKKEREKEKEGERFHVLISSTATSKFRKRGERRAKGTRNFSKPDSFFFSFFPQMRISPRQIGFKILYSNDLDDDSKLPMRPVRSDNRSVL